MSTIMAKLNLLYPALLGQIGGEGSDLGKEEEKDKEEGRREEGEERRDIKTGSKDGLPCTTSHR